MSLATVTSRKDYTLTGGVYNFPFPYLFNQESDLVVVYTDTAGNPTTLILNSSYTVTGAGTISGGITVAANYTSGTLSIIRQVSLTQDVVLDDQGKFSSTVIENEFDKLTMIDQQMQEQLGRTPMLPKGLLGSTLPPPSNGSTLGWVAGAWAWVAGAVSNLQTLLAAGSGAGLVGYLAPYTGAAARTQAQKNAEVVTVTDYIGCDPTGATDSYVAFAAAHAALPASGGTIIVPDAVGYKINTQITCTKPVLWKIAACTITGPASGYLFEIQANKSGIEMGAGSILKATQGCLGLVHNNQTMNCHYWNMNFDPNNCTNMISLFHDGGWYINVKNMWLDNSREHSTSCTLKIKSTYTGVAGPTGSYGGAFVGHYENVIGKKFWILGDLPTSTTTMTFVNCSWNSTVISDSTGLTFLQPIIQGNYTFFDLTNVAGLTCIGGDFEAGNTDTSARVYVFNGGSNRDIKSIGNNCAGFNPGGITAKDAYITGYTSAGGVFDDNYLTGAKDDSTRFGSTPGQAFHNQGFTTQGHVGLPYTGDVLVTAQNIRLTSATTGFPYDASVASTAIYMDTSAQIKFLYAYAATAWVTATGYVVGNVIRVGTRAYTCAINHTSGTFATDLASGKWTVGGNVTLNSIAMFDGGGLTVDGSTVKFTNLPSASPGAGSKRLWYDGADGNRVKFAV
jgi:hypothetical protein